MARRLDRLVVEVGAENLDIALALRGLRALAHQDRQRIDLFSRRAARDPGTEGVVFRPRLHHPGQHFRRQDAEGLRIAEEVRHADQQLFEEDVRLVGILVEELHILRELLELMEVHPPLDPPVDGTGFIGGKVVPGPVAKQDEDLLHRHGRSGGAILSQGCGEMESPCVGDQLAGHFRRGQHEIGEPGGDRAARHAGIFRRLHLLDHRHPPFALDGPQPQRPVGPRPGQHDADRLVLLVLRQRAEKRVDRQMRRLGFPGLHPVQDAAQDREGSARRADVNVVGLGFQPVADLHHRQPGDLAEQFRQQAGVPRVLVGDHHEGHAGVQRHLAEKLIQRLQAAGRGPDANHRESAGLPHRTLRCGGFLGDRAARSDRFLRSHGESGCRSASPDHETPAPQVASFTYLGYGSRSEDIPDLQEGT